MIPVPSAARVWIATGVTNTRRGMNGLALLVQEGLGRNPHAGDLYAFRGLRGDLIKCLWHDGLGLLLDAKRLEKGRFLWPTPSEDAVAITSAQLGYLLEGIDWRNPQRTWRPAAGGTQLGLVHNLGCPEGQRISFDGRHDPGRLFPARRHRRT